MFIIALTPGKKRLLIISLSLTLILIAFTFRGFLYRTFVQEKVEPDVYFMDMNMGKLTQKEVEEIVAFHIGEWQLNPIDAQYNGKEHSIVPETWGYRANVEKTVQKIFHATTGEHVTFYLEIIMPGVTMDDYPSAVISRGNSVKESVAFMINVAWGTEHIPPLLDVLAAHDAKGSFFLVGKWAEENEPLVREMIKRGHLVGNHGHTDAAVITEMEPDELKEGLKDFNVYLETVTQAPVCYFTPHKGEYDRHGLEVISRLGMRTLLWSVDTIDWMEPGVEAMQARVLEKVHHGAIILMHPTEDTVFFAQNILPELKKKGLSVVTVEELLNPDIMSDPIPGG